MLEQLRLQEKKNFSNNNSKLLDISEEPEEHNVVEIKKREGRLSDNEIDDEANPQSESDLNKIRSSPRKSILKKGITKQQTTKNKVYKSENFINTQEEIMMEELREEAERQKIADEKRKAQRLAIEEENRRKREQEEKKRIDRVPQLFLN